MLLINSNEMYFHIIFPTSDFGCIAYLRNPRYSFNFLQICLQTFYYLFSIPADILQLLRLVSFLYFHFFTT